MALARILLAALIGAAFGVARATAAPAPAPANPPSLLMICIDTLRADHVGCYGYDRDTTPNLDRLAAESAVFLNALSTSSWTKPSHASVFTGLYPQAHRTERFHDILPPDQPTLAEILAARGYATGAVVTAPALHAKNGFDRGFEFYDDYSVFAAEQALHPGRFDYYNKLAEKSDAGIGEVVHNSITAPHVNRAALQWLDQQGDGPWFLFVHYWEPHGNYLAPGVYRRRFDPEYPGFFDGVIYAPEFNSYSDPDDVRRAISLYDGDIAWNDQVLGELLESLEREGRLENTAIVVFSDHGESFFEHGQKAHGVDLYQESIRTALVIRPPEKLSPGARIHRAASLVDVAPTVLGMLGIAAAETQFDGVDLFDPETDDEERMVFSRLRLNQHDWDAAFQGRWKWMRNIAKGEEYLFDLEKDPEEQDNRLSVENETAARLRRAYENLGGGAAGNPFPAPGGIDKNEAHYEP